MFKKAASAAAASEGPRHTFFGMYVEVPSDARTKLEDFFNILL